ncbi:MAG: outer membrane lipoprotein carrier protein LolA [Desulfovibrio sp.]|nr:outer membrane lipoprotein carrier protein LolA [Desulfovibrio sp.]
MFGHLPFALLIILGTLLCLTPARAFEFNEDVVEFLQKLAEQNQAIHTMSANFVQVKRVAVLNRSLDSQGYFCLRKAPAVAESPEMAATENAPKPSDALLFTYTKPLVSGFIFRDGQGHLWQDNPRKTFVARVPGQNVVVAVAEHTFALLRANPVTLLANYTVSLLRNNSHALRLIPHRQTYFSRIDALFNREDGGLRKIQLLEANGDSVEITFQNVHVNDILPERCDTYLPKLQEE